MSILNDTYCQLRERFTTKEQWINHLYSNRHLDREVNEYCPAIFPQRNLTRGEGSVVEKAFWKRICATQDIKNWTSF